MSRRPRLPFPNRFRRRLTIAFVVVAGLAAGTLAAGSFLAVSEQRHEAFVMRSKQQTRVALTLTQGEAGADRLDALVGATRQRIGFETIVVDDRTVSSRADLGIGDIPESVRNPGPGLSTAFIRFDDEPYLVVGADVPNNEHAARIFLLFPETDLRNALGEMRRALFAGWVAVVFASALAGHYVARRTLEPIQQSADAARSLAEGLLHTRLPTTGADEFAAWARYFNDMAEALERKIDELSRAHERERRFTADVAHDLRTPLASMVNASTLLAMQLEELPDSARRPAELLIGDVDRMRRLVSDLLELGRLDAGGEASTFEPVALADFLAQLAGRAGDEVTVVVPDVTINGDRRRLERIVANLLENAVVHGGGNVAMRATVEGGRLIIDVEDEGPGISDDELDLVFERFHKVSPSRSTSGSGLGLAIAKQHAEVLGGTLTAFNRAEGGARFRLEFPVESET